MSLFNEVEVDKSSFQPLKKQNASFYGAYDNKINDYATSAIVSSEIKNATSNNVLISKKDLDSGLLPLPDNYRSAAHASLPIVGKIFTSNSSTVKFDRFINSNVTYTFSASSVRLQTGNDFSPYNAFNGYENDNVTSSYWISSNAYDLSGFYIGTNSTNNISGEWIQVQLSIPAIVCSYGVLNGEGYLRIPFNTNTRKYSLMASNDGIDFTLIDTNKFIPGYTPNEYTITVSNNNVSYTYFRLVVTETYGGSMTYISRFDLGFLSPYSFELKGPFQYASLFDSTNYSSSSIEFEIWIKTSVSLQDKVYGIVVKDNAFGLYLCNGILMTYNFITNEKTFGNFKCNDNTWCRVGLIINNSAGVSKIMRNGVREKMFIPGTINQNSFLTIGNGGSVGGMFIGLLSEFRIWSPPRSDDDILLGNNSIATVGYWPLDSGGDQGFSLVKGNQITAANFILYGAPLPTYSRDSLTIIRNYSITPQIIITYNKYLTFDGTSQYAVMDNITYYAYSIGTVECWVKTTATYGAIISKGNAYGIFLNNNKLAVYNFSTSIWTYGNTTINNGDWHHVAFVFNGSDSFLFVDGLLDSVAFSYVVRDQSLKLSIGSQYENQANLFLNCSIAEPRIWSIARTSTQIQTNYNLRLKTILPDGQWVMEEGSGNILANTGPTNYQFTLFNNPIWNTGGPITL